VFTSNLSPILHCFGKWQYGELKAENVASFPIPLIRHPTPDVPFGNSWRRQRNYRVIWPVALDTPVKTQDHR